MHTILCMNLFLTGGCPVLGDPANGMVTWTSFTTGSVATYECDRGFELVGQMTRTCRRNLEWSGVPPICRRGFISIIFIILSKISRHEIYCTWPSYYPLGHVL